MKGFNFFVLVSMTPENKQYGALRVWMDDVASYSLVCADGFTDVEATTACMDMGYAYGKSICCSAFGDVEGKVEIYIQKLLYFFVIYSILMLLQKNTLINGNNYIHMQLIS